jgi:hypothetical protein
MHLLLTPDWDTDGKTLKACNLPQHVVALNAPDDAHKDEHYINGKLSEALSETFGFSHNGFTVVPVTLTDNRADLPKTPDKKQQYTVSIMEAPEK